VTWELTVTGLLIGALVGMTGMGGGSLMTPMLVLFFGFDPMKAIGTDILHGAVFKSFGAVRHRMLKTVHLRLTCWMLLGSAPMALVGVKATDALKDRYGSGVEDVSAQILGFALIAAGVGLFVKSFVTGRAKSDAPFRLANRDRVIALLTGLAGGFVVGLTSVGTGTFFGLVMLLAFPLTARKVVGTDLWHAAALLWVAGAGHLAAGNVDMRATGWLLLGSVPGVLLGSQVTVKLPENSLRLGLATVLAASGVALSDVPANQVLVILVMVAGVLAAVVTEVKRLNGRVAAAISRAR
jgi:uncharacterized membrane protein YfcA